MDDDCSWSSPHLHALTHKCHIGGLDTISNSSTTAWRVMKVAPLPEAVAQLKQGALSVKTRFGVAAVSWQLDQENAFSLNVTVPVGSQAEVHMPDQVGGMRLLSPILVNGKEHPSQISRIDLPSGNFFLSAVFK